MDGDAHTRRQEAVVLESHRSQRDSEDREEGMKVVVVER